MRRGWRFRVGRWSPRAIQSLASLLASVPSVLLCLVVAEESIQGASSALLAAPPQQKTASVVSESELRTTADRLTREASALQGKGGEQTTRQSIAIGQQALSAWRLLGDRAGEGAALHLIGRSHYLLGDLSEAVEHYEAALSIRRDLGDRQAEAATRAYLASTYQAKGEQDRALAEYLTAAGLAQAVQDRNLHAYALNGIGIVHHTRGDPFRALELYEQAMDLWASAGDSTSELRTLNNVGALYQQLGEPDRALRAYTDALPRMRAAGLTRYEAGVLVNVGNTYADLGQTEQALAFYARALAMQRRIGDRRTESSTRVSRGYLYGLAGNVAAAGREYQQALVLARRVGDRGVEAAALRGIGEVRATRGLHTEAVEWFRQAQAIHEAVGNIREQAEDVHALAVSLGVLGRHDESLTRLREALALRVRSGDLSGQAATLYRIAQAEAHRERVDQARAAIDAALQVTESLRAKLTPVRLRTSYFTTVQEYYRWYIDFLVALHRTRPAEGFDVAAFDVSERSRARGLLDRLSESGIDLRNDADPTLLQRQRRVEQLLRFTGNRMEDLSRATADANDRARAEQTLTDLLTEFERVEFEIKNSSIRYATLAWAAPLRLNEVQRLIDTDTTVLNYVFGQGRGYVWVVTRTAAALVELPEARDLEILAGMVRQVVSAHPLADPQPGAPRLLAGCRATPKTALACLSAAILGPVGGLLRTERVAIVTDGALAHVPFATLPSPLSLAALSKTSDDQAYESLGAAMSPSRRADAPPSPLLYHREVVYLPSFSTLALLRRYSEARKPAPRSVAIFADPVFALDDPRISLARSDATGTALDTRASTSRTPTLQRPMQAASEPGRFTRLTASRREADAIAALAGNDSLRALDFQASRATVESTDLRAYRVLHFATHAVINDRYPELSGILLSSVTERGDRQDGWLRLQDLYSLKVAADVVVLSACESALGMHMRGEGVVGLARGFMAAGASRVVASLWKVDDAATAELMQIFYSGLLREGLRPAVALRRAQTTLSEHPRWRSSYYWAAFVLEGEWR
jgi:tetratricopeptide (TPR) repeat protein